MSVKTDGTTLFVFREQVLYEIQHGRVPVVTFFISTVVIYSTMNVHFNSGYIRFYTTAVIYSTTKCSFQLRMDKSNLTSNLLLPLRRHYSGSDGLYIQLRMFISTVVIYSTMNVHFNSGYIRFYTTAVIYSTTKCSFQLRMDKSNLTSNLLLPLRRHYSGSDGLTHVMSDRLERQKTASTCEYDLVAFDLFKDDVTDIRCHVIVWRRVWFEYCHVIVRRHDNAGVR